MAKSRLFSEQQMTNFWILKFLMLPFIDYNRLCSSSLIHLLLNILGRNGEAAENILVNRNCLRSSDRAYNHQAWWRRLRKVVIYTSFNEIPASVSSVLQRWIRWSRDFGGPRWVDRRSWKQQHGQKQWWMEWHGSRPWSPDPN